MHVDKLGKGELIAAVGGVLLGLCIFLPWYEANPDNPNAVVAGVKGGSVSALGGPSRSCASCCWRRPSRR